MAEIIGKISDQRVHVRQANRFVQEIARQAIVNEESMMTREISFDGFGAAPLLSESLFRDPFILRQYEPLQGLWYKNLELLSEGYVTRLNAASLMMLETALEHHGYWGSHYMHHVYSAYEGIFLHCSIPKNKNLAEQLDSSLTLGIEKLYRAISENLEQMDSSEYRGLFIKDTKEYRSDLVGIVTRIVFESLEFISNSFTDFNGRGWTRAMNIYRNIYLPYGETPAGMDPLQQQLSVMIIEKLRDNMNGWYPSISKVLLAIIGPYESRKKTENRTAHAILTDAVYKELQKLSELYFNKPHKFGDFLPNNVTYDPKKNSLTHTYRGGESITTNLSSLKIPDIDLLDEKNWRT